MLTMKSVPWNESFERLALLLNKKEIYCRKTNVISPTPIKGTYLKLKNDMKLTYNKVAFWNRSWEDVFNDFVWPVLILNP